MIKDSMINFGSLLIVKDRQSFSINCSFNCSTKIVSITNAIYEKERHNFQLIPFNTERIYMKTNNKNQYYMHPILIKHSIFDFYINKYKIENIYLIKNIEEFYRLTKVFIDMFNKRFGTIYNFNIDINHETVFSIIKYNEKKLNDIEKYKKEKVDNIFSEELFYILRKL